MNNKNLALAGAILLAGVMLFYGGIKFEQYSNYADSQAILKAADFERTQGGPGIVGEVLFAGEIIKAETDSLTMKLAGGKIATIHLSATTPMIKYSIVTNDSLTAGDHITVAGALNKDGSVNARTLRIGSSVPSK